MTAPDLSLPIAVRASAPAQVRRPAPDLGLTWAPLTREGSAALAALVARVETADDEPYRTSLEEVEEKFDGAWKNHELDTIGGTDADGTLRAWGQVVQPPGDTRVVRAFVEGGVDPLWRGRGVGRALLEFLVDRGRQLLAASGKDVPGRIGAFASEQAASSIALLRAAGLEPIRVYSEMRRPLGDDLPAAVLPPGLRIETWSPARDDEVRLAHNEAFASHWGSEPQTAEAWAEGRSQFAPQWSLVAVDDSSGEVVGYLLSGRYEQDWEIAGHSSGYVELLGVRPGWRRRGIAPALLATVLATLRADGIEYGEIGVDTENLSGALGLYTSLGFAPFHRSTLYTIEL